MKIMTLQKQNDVYKRLIHIITELMKLETDEARYAIGDAFDIALIVGGREMLDAIGGIKPSKTVGSTKEELSNGLSKCIDFIDEITDATIDCQWK